MTRTTVPAATIAAEMAMIANSPIAIAYMAQSRMGGACPGCGPTDMHRPPWPLLARWDLRSNTALLPAGAVRSRPAALSLGRLTGGRTHSHSAWCGPPNVARATGGRLSDNRPPFP
jgi:hypothetical protein